MECQEVFFGFTPAASERPAPEQLESVIGSRLFPVTSCLIAKASVPAFNRCHTCFFKLYRGSFLPSGKPFLLRDRADQDVLEVDPICAMTPVGGLCVQANDEIVFKIPRQPGNPDG